MRFDDFGGSLVTQAVATAPFVDLGPPFVQCLAIRQSDRQPLSPRLILDNTAVKPPLQVVDQRGGRCGSLVVLRHVIGLSAEEIARVMATNRTAVYAALARAERTLRRSLDRGAVR